MNCPQFQERLLAFVDDELSATESEAASAHVGSCGDCRDRARFERELESRVGAALLSGTSAPDVAELLSRAKPGAAVASSGRLLTLRRVLGAAAALLLVIQTAWFFCIPPFECSYLQAVELAADAPVATDTRPTSERLLRLTPPHVVPGYEIAGAPELVRVGYAGVEYGIRARYVGPNDSFTILWCDPQGARPSFRRLTQQGDAEWWIADENGHNLVAWMCPVTDTMCTLVGDIPEDSLLRVASDIRGN